MAPQQAVNDLIGKGCSQAQIVALLKTRGVETTQPTISRIASGKFSNPGFELGTAIVKLCQDYEKESATNAA